MKTTRKTTRRTKKVNPNRIQAIGVERLDDDADPDTSYLEQKGWEKRLEQYRNGDFTFIGIRAVAQVVIEGACQTLTSSGFWGIESDSSEDYFYNVGKGELFKMREILQKIGFSKREISRAEREI